jgi:uroporphyrinogen-III synthase
MNKNNTGVKIKKILVSQPLPESNRSPFFELAKKNNLTVDFRPFIQVECVSLKEFRKQKVNILEHTAVIFTSRTGIDHFFNIAKELKICIPETMKYFCINEATAFYLQKYIVYRKRKIFYGTGVFDDMIDVLTKHKDENFLVPLSDTAKADIPKKLKKNKFKFTKAIFYKTVSTDLSDMQKVDYDILVFYSPSGIKSLFQNFPDFQQKDIKIATFGQSTAKAVKDAGLRLDIAAPAPKAPSMTMALENYIEKHNK